VNWVRAHTEKRSWLLAFAALLLLLSLCLVCLHHHSSFDQTNDCFVCHFLHETVYVLLFAVAAFILSRFTPQKFFPLSLQTYISQFLLTRLQNRAPPFPA